MSVVRWDYTVPASLRASYGASRAALDGHGWRVAAGRLWQAPSGLVGRGISAPTCLQAGSCRIKISPHFQRASPIACLCAIVWSVPGKHPTCDRGRTVVTHIGPSFLAGGLEMQGRDRHDGKCGATTSFVPAAVGGGPSTSLPALESELVPAHTPPPFQWEDLHSFFCA